MNPVWLRLPASLKIPACIAIGCGGTLTVQRYTASSSLSWDEKAATEKEDSGKGMKFEINQLSKQLEEKEQSLKTWEEMLAKQAADLKEQQAAVSSVSAQTTTVTTVAESKPDQPIIDDVPFGEEDAKPGKLKASNIAQRGITKREAEVPTDGVPKRPAVFDGGGTPAVAFPPTTDVVAIKEGGDIPERLQAELRGKDRALEVLSEQREEARKEKEADLAKYEAELRRLDGEKDALEAELTEKDRRLTELNTLNEDLKRELEETKEQLAKADADVKEKVLRLEPESSISLACLRGNEWEDPEKQSEYLKDWLSQRKLLPKDGSFAVCRLKPKEASCLWNFGFQMIKRMFCLDKRRGALTADMVRKQKVDLSDVNECFTCVPFSIYDCTTSDPDGGMVVKRGNDRYSVRPQPRGFLCCLFCPCKKRTNGIRKLKYEETVVEVTSEEPQDSPKIPELSDVLSFEEKVAFDRKEAEIENGLWTSLECQNSEAESEGNSDNRHKTVPGGSSRFVSFGDNDGLLVFGLVRWFNEWWHRGK